MREEFLQFVWQYQYFEKSNLKTTSGDVLTVFKQGMTNASSGPDFSDCRIKVNDIEWAGNAEIHYKSSDWYAHHHEVDKAYDNVVLHVVWTDDRPVRRRDLSLVPTLELKDRIEAGLIHRYEHLIKGSREILCASFFESVPGMVKLSMLDKMGMERLEQKSCLVTDMLRSSGHNWEQTSYSLLATNFGFKLNGFAFARLSQLLPLKLLLKHADSLFQMEALLFGTAGLLHREFQDEYPRTLKKEFEFLSHKYDLKDHQMSEGEWKFAKVRPPNFPTVRIAEFAAFIRHNPSLFSLFLETDQAAHLASKMNFETSPYWTDHYVFDNRTAYHQPKVGMSSVYSIAINTVVPLLIAYAKEKDSQAYIERAVSLLESMPLEKNAITDRWLGLPLALTNAFDSQAALQLYNNYCRKKACLSCNIGLAILKGSA